jgi:hypothetical protein
MLGLPPAGAGYITPQGYRRMQLRGKRGALRFEHVLVWEAAHGPIPPNHDIHHKNGDRLDNRIENLEAIPRLTHKRLHLGYELRDGVWWKRCHCCREEKAADSDFYRRHDGIDHICKVCRRAQSRRDSQRRRMRRSA